MKLIVSWVIGCLCVLVVVRPMSKVSDGGRTVESKYFEIAAIAHEVDSA